MNTFVELSNVAVETLLLCYFMNRAYAPIASDRNRRLLLFVLYGCILALLSVFPIPAMIRGGYSLISIVLIAKPTLNCPSAVSAEADSDAFDASGAASDASGAVEADGCDTPAAHPAKAITKSTQSTTTKSFFIFSSPLWFI